MKSWMVTAAVLVSLTAITVEAAPPPHCPLVFHAHVHSAEFSGPVVFVWDESRLLYAAGFYDGELTVAPDVAEIEGSVIATATVPVLSWSASSAAVDWSFGPLGHALFVPVISVTITPTELDFGDGWDFQRISLFMFWGFAGLGFIGQAVCEGFGWFFRSYRESVTRGLGDV